MASIFQNILPASVKLPVSQANPIIQPPLNQPLPVNILPPGFQPQLPARVIPSAPAHSVKEMLNNLPSLFKIKHQ